MTAIVFFNQGGGQLFREFVLGAADRFDSVTYYAPDAGGEFPGSISVVKTSPHKNTNTMERLWGWMSYLAFAGLHGLSQQNRPLLFIVTNPPLTPILGLLAHLLKQQPYVLLFYDMYPEAIEHFGGLSPNSLVARLWRKLNRFAIRHAAYVFTVSPGLAETLSQYLPTGNSRKRLAIVPTWVDTELIQPIPKEQNWFADQYGQCGKVTVLYSGNMGNVHDLSMLPAIAERLKLYPNIHFLVIGEGAKRNALVEECNVRQLTNMTFLPYQSADVLPFALACGDIGIVALAIGAEGVSMPSKTYSMMAAGTALLGLSSAQSDLANVISEYRCGVNIQPGDIETAVQMIITYHDDPVLLAYHRRQARESAVRYFSRNVCVPQMLDVIGNLRTSDAKSMKQTSQAS